MSLSIGIITGEITFKPLNRFTIYPSSEPNAIEVEYKNTKTGDTYKGFIPDAELKLMETIKSMGLKPEALAKLVEAIDGYTEEQTDKATFDATYEG